MAGMGFALNVGLGRTYWSEVKRIQDVSGMYVGKAWTKGSEKLSDDLTGDNPMNVGCPLLIPSD